MGASPGHIRKLSNPAWLAAQVPNIDQLKKSTAKYCDSNSFQPYLDMTTPASGLVCHMLSLRVPLSYGSDATSSSLELQVQELLEPHAGHLENGHLKGIKPAEEPI